MRCAASRWKPAASAPPAGRADAGAGNGPERSFRPDAQADLSGLRWRAGGLRPRRPGDPGPAAAHVREAPRPRGLLEAARPRARVLRQPEAPARRLRAL